LQQAAKDYQMAEFYRRTGHPGSAWFYYDLVRLRYPNLKPYYQLATDRMEQIRRQVEKEKGPGKVPPLGPPGQQGPAVPAPVVENAPTPRPVVPPPAVPPPPGPLPPSLDR
jgi:hypothetical protein